MHQSALIHLNLRTFVPLLTKRDCRDNNRVVPGKVKPGGGGGGGRGVNSNKITVSGKRKCLFCRNLLSRVFFLNDTEFEV